MLKWLQVFLLLTIINLTSFAQSVLVVAGTSPKLYLLHKVAPKENFYSVSRKYNIPPKDIASYNNLQFEKGLSLGQTIKIPLNESNFLQAENASESPDNIPVYHSVLPKEGLYRVSVNYNKVSLISLKKWNHLPSDEVSIGTPLIVGYLKTAYNGASSEERLAKPGAQRVTLPSVETNTQPAVTNEKTEAHAPVPVAVIEKPEQKNKSKHTKPTEHKESVSGINAKASSINFSGGYFKKLYDDQISKKSPVNDIGNVGVFKSTSGWQDGKYYCFNNDAPPGSVIKITNNETNKSVYAKVLDAVPDIKQNAGYIIIISNAAAEELGGGEKFYCALSYIK